MDIWCEGLCWNNTNHFSSLKSFGNIFRDEFFFRMQWTETCLQRYLNMRLFSMVWFWMNLSMCLYGKLLIIGFSCRFYFQYIMIVSVRSFFVIITHVLDEIYFRTHIYIDFRFFLNQPKSDCVYIY